MNYLKNDIDDFDNIDNIDNIDFDYIDNEYIININNYKYKYEKNNIYLIYQEKYKEELRLLKNEINNKNMNKTIESHIILKRERKNRFSNSFDFERAIILSGLPKNIINNIKKSINLFRELDENKIYLSEELYKYLIDFIKSKKHRLKDEYIEYFIYDNIEKIENNIY